MEIVTTDKAPAAIGPYSQAIKSKGFLFASGQIPVIPASGEIDGNSIETQAERVMKNVESISEHSSSNTPSVIFT